MAAQRPQRREHPFAAEARELVAALPNARGRVYYTQPGADDVEGECFDATGRLTGSVLAELGLPVDGQAYICGPGPFMDAISAGLASLGVDAALIHTEPFGPAASQTPGIAAVPARAPHAPAGSARSRSDDRVRAERPRRSVERGLRQPARIRRGLRRAGALVLPDRRVSDVRDDAHRGGESGYDPDPVEAPPDGSVLLCCSGPAGDIVLDL